MCFFLSLLALKSRKIRLLKPDSCNIKGSYTSINERVTSTTCPYRLSIMSSSFRGIRYNTGNWISSYLGGAIYLKSNPEVVMFDNKFERLLAGNDGGAAYFDGVAIINSTKNKFLNCEANSGGAIYITGSKSVINVIDNQFESLTGHFRGAALYVDKSKELQILNTSLANINLLDERGYGGSLYFSTIVNVDINQCLINSTRCSYESGGAGFFDKLSDLNITKTNFVGCYAQDHGGALNIQSSSTINIIENLFSSCEMVNESNFNQRIGGAINIETSNPVYLQRNSFINCYAYHYGGAISFYSSDRLTLSINTFNNCSVKNNQGGAISARSLENISLAENIYKKCYANQYGGAIYLEALTNGNFFIVRDEFIECNSSDYGGAISLYNVNGMVIKEIKCSKCKSSQGGVLYTYDMKACIEIADSAFNECEAYTDGGAVCVDRKRVGRIQVIYIKITETNFTKCKASTGSGGGLFIERNVNYIILKSSHFLSCFAKLNGAALYYKYDFSFIKDEVLISSEFNIFEDCESGNLGTVAISSYNVDSALFENETYINCRAATGGAFMADITDYSQLFFVGCEISNCSATLKCGALGFKLGNTKNDNSSVINIRRCSFFNCSSREAACIGTESTYPAFVSLNIEGEIDTLTSFNSINGINNRYVIITDAYNLKIRFVVFNQVEIGAIQTCGNNLNLSACSFNFCTSTYSIIKCDSLRIFNINDTTFSHCGNCFQITSLSKGIISSLILTDIEYDFPSIISSDQVDIDNLKIQNNLEPIQLNVSKLYINGGSLINSSKIIRIIGSGRGDSLTIINDLNVENSLMFLIEKMANARIINSNITYNSINSVGESIIVSRTVITSLINCSFLTNNINSIDFTIPSSSARLQGCTFDGNDSLIKVGNSLSLRNNTFKSNGRYFNISTSGVLLFYLNSNCFINDDFSSAIGNGRVMDHLRRRAITSFNDNNNRCHGNSHQTTEQEVLNEIISTSEEQEVFTESLSSSFRQETESFKQGSSSQFITKPIESSEIQDKPSDAQVSISNSDLNDIDDKSQTKNAVTKSFVDHKLQLTNLQVNNEITDEMRDSLNIIKDNLDEGNIIGTKKPVRKEMVIGIVIGSVALVAIIIISIFIIICKNKNSKVTSSFDDGESELETVESSTFTINNEFKTSFSTQEMPTTMWTNVRSILNDDNDFVNRGSDEESN